MPSHTDSALTLGWRLILSNYVSSLPGSSDGSVSPQFCDNAISTFTPSHRLSSLYLPSFSPLRGMPSYPHSQPTSYVHWTMCLKLSPWQFSFLSLTAMFPSQPPHYLGWLGGGCNHCTFCYEGNTCHNFPFLSPPNQSSYRQFERVMNTRYLASYSILLSLFPLPRPTANCSHQRDKHYL